jgi:protein SMG6
MVHNLMEISLAPSIPTSLRVIPTKHNIIIRLWTHTVHKLLEALYCASFASPLALEHLQDFIYFAYTFYTGLLKEPSLRTIYSGWLEALGDLACYRMAATAMVTSNQLSGCALAAGTISQANAASADDVLMLQRASHRSASGPPPIGQQHASTTRPPRALASSPPA